MRKWKLQYVKDGYVIQNENGTTIPYDPSSGIQILEIDGYAFLDLNGNGRLDGFEDWRKDELTRYAELKYSII